VRTLPLLFLLALLACDDPESLHTGDDDDDQVDDDDDQVDDDDDQVDDDTTADDDDQVDPCEQLAGVYSGPLDLEVRYPPSEATTYHGTLTATVDRCQIRGTVAGAVDVSAFFGIIAPDGEVLEGAAAGDFYHAGPMVQLWAGAHINGTTFHGYTDEQTAVTGYRASISWTTTRE